MAYDRETADRVRECLQDEPGLSEKRMFGGLAFLIDGHMTVAVSREGGLLLRVDPAQVSRLADGPHARRAVMGGREMSGWLRVDEEGLRTSRALRRWVNLARRRTHTLAAT